jgi:hypothetical protein
MDRPHQCHDRIVKAASTTNATRAPSTILIGSQVPHGIPKSNMSPGITPSPLSNASMLSPVSPSLPTSTSFLPVMRPTYHSGNDTKEEVDAAPLTLRDRPDAVHLGDAHARFDPSTSTLITATEHLISGRLINHKRPLSQVNPLSSGDNQGLPFIHSLFDLRGKVVFSMLHSCVSVYVLGTGTSNKFGRLLKATSAEQFEEVLTADIAADLIEAPFASTTARRGYGAWANGLIDEWLTAAITPSCHCMVTSKFNEPNAVRSAYLNMRPWILALSTQGLESIRSSTNVDQWLERRSRRQPLPILRVCVSNLMNFSLPLNSHE